MMRKALLNEGTVSMIRWTGRDVRVRHDAGETHGCNEVQCDAMTSALRQSLDILCSLVCDMPLLAII